MRSYVISVGMYLLTCVALPAGATTPVQAAINEAKRSIAYDLKDPDSARFRNVRAGFRGKSYMVCGEINAKNSYGAYNGFKPFVSWAGIKTIANDTIDAVSNRAMMTAVPGMCSNILDKGAPPPEPDASLESPNPDPIP